MKMEWSAVILFGTGYCQRLIPSLCGAHVSFNTAAIITLCEAIGMYSIGTVLYFPLKQGKNPVAETPAMLMELGAKDQPRWHSEMQRTD